MCPGTEPGQGQAEELPAHLVAEGASFAVPLLRRISAGTSSPADFAAVLAILQCDPTRYGFAAVVFQALRQAAAAPQRGRT